MSSVIVNQSPLTVDQIKSLTNAQIAALTAAAISGLTAADIAAFAPSQIASMQAAQIAALSTTALAALTPAQAAALSSTQIAALTPARLATLSSAALAALASTVVAVLTAAQVGSLSPAEIAALKPAQVAALQPAVIAALSTASLAALSTSAVAALGTAQIAALRPLQIPAFTPAQIAALTPAAIAALATSDISALGGAQAAALLPAQMAALQPTQLAALSTTALAAVPASAFAALGAAQAAALRPLQVPALTPAQIAAMTAAAISALPASDISSLSAAQAAALKPAQVAALQPAQVAALSVAALAALTATAFAALSAAQAAALRPAQIPALTPAQIAAMTPAAIGALPVGDISTLSAAQAAALKPAQVAALQLAQVAALSAAALAALPTSDIAALSTAQTAALRPAQIPALMPVQIAALTPAAVAALPTADIAELSAAQAAALLPAQVAALQAAEVAALSTAALAALPTTDIAVLTTAQAEALRPLQVPAFTTAQIAALTTTVIAAFSQTEVAALSAAQLAALSPTQVAALPTPPHPTVTTTTGGTQGGPQAPLTQEASVPQPTEPGQVVGLVLQNPTAASLAAREITFGMTFSQGQVPLGQSLVATIGDTKVAVQMDVKTTYADGSVDTAVLTLAQPQLAANASAGVMLSLSGAAAAATPLSLAALTNPAAYNFTVALTIHNANGTTTPYVVNVGQLLKQALANGTVSYWLQGPQATQGRIDVPVTGSLHLTFDITRYADGSTSTDVQFNNDIAMSASGGTLVYDTTITQNGTVVLQQNDITEYQYQTWDQTFWSNGTPQVNVQHDVQALENTGAVQAYDVTNGVDTSSIASEGAAMLGAGFGILGNADLTEYMPTTGGRDDIGPTTLGNTIWLMTQNATAAQFALDQAAASGSVPWHLYDPTTGTYLMVTSDPNLWADPRGGSSGTTGLTQDTPDFYNQANPASGWAVDPAHEPDLDYVAYLLTGDRYYLDQLNAEASYDILDMTPSARLDGQGIVANDYTQVREQAWSLREVVEAAYANPDGSAEKTYFTQIMNNNFQYLLNEAASVTATEGDAFGYVLWGQGNGWNGYTAPWQQDYFATTVVLAAEQGSAPAAQLLSWESNFLVGLFNSAAAGFSSYDGAAYQVVTWQNGQWLQSWAQIEQATAALGLTGNGTWNALAYPAYRAEALSVLAGDFTVTQAPDALKAYGWLLASSGITPAWEAANPTWDIVPRLSDGNYIDASNSFIHNDSGTTTIQGGNSDQLIFEQGSGNVTIVGGSGINVLFAGTGNDTLQGGSGADFLYAGTGTDVLSGGAGSNYMEAGIGADTFLLNVLDTAQDIIADFKVGIDHLHVIGAAGTPDTAAQILALIKGATQDAAGDAVLHLSGNHEVTLHGIGVPSLSAGLFG